MWYVRPNCILDVVSGRKLPKIQTYLFKLNRLSLYISITQHTQFTSFQVNTIYFLQYFLVFCGYLYLVCIKLTHTTFRLIKSGQYLCFDLRQFAQQGVDIITLSLFPSNCKCLIFRCRNLYLLARSIVFRHQFAQFPLNIS